MRQIETEMRAVIDDHIVAHIEDVQIARIGTGPIARVVRPKIDLEVDAIDAAFEDARAAAVENLPGGSANGTIRQPFITGLCPVLDLFGKATAARRIAVGVMKPRKADPTAVYAQPCFAVMGNGLTGSAESKPGQHAPVSTKNVFQIENCFMPVPNLLPANASFRDVNNVILLCVYVLKFLLRQCRT